MPARGHAALDRLRGGDVDYVVEEVGLSMLSSEILTNSNAISSDSLNRIMKRSIKQIVNKEKKSSLPG